MAPTGDEETPQLEADAVTWGRQGDKLQRRGRSRKDNAASTSDGTA